MENQEAAQNENEFWWAGISQSFSDYFYNQSEREYIDLWIKTDNYMDVVPVYGLFQR